MTNKREEATTNDAGIPVSSDVHSLMIGPGGPILLFDHDLIEQAAFAPSNHGTGFSLDKMLLARTFANADAHRGRIGVNYKQVPVNTPKTEVHSYPKDGAMRVTNATDPVYAPNSSGGPKVDPSRTAEAPWYAGHLRNGVSEEVLQRAFEYWRNVDIEIGDHVENSVRSVRHNGTNGADLVIVPDLQERQAIS